MAKERFDHRLIEKELQEAWARRELYAVDFSDTRKDPYYLLFEFPYPSGDLHMGHWYAFALTDIFARLKRMQGKQVLFPIGFDAFGLPAENAAIKNGVDPREWTYANMDRMRTQIRSMGTSVDWSKEVVTCDPHYYKWTQWLFSKLFEHNLAERRLAAVKWCPKDKTVLANEQVVDGVCERCGTEVEEKNLTQWFLKITDYAPRLLTDLDPLPWREDIKDAQRAWIGRSEGAKLSFSIAGTDHSVDVFTTRPDTIFGATYLVLAPEHPYTKYGLTKSVFSNAQEVEKYIKQTSQKTERERSENKEKTGVRLEGITAINPATKEEIPVYIADYVLASYGTGAVMAVPAHDERDFEFAKKMQLPVVYVVDPATGTKQENPEDKRKIVAIVEDGDKILSIHWKPELGGRLFVGGTAEENEAPTVTAMREIAEETGYTDLELVEAADEMVHHEYFAHSKNKAFIAHTILLHFRLRSKAQQPTALEDNEIGKFVVEWITKEQAIKEVTDPLHRYAFNRFVLNLCYTGDGLLRNSGEFTDRDNREAMAEIVAFAGGEMTTNYRIRDWLVSRQRYWGCPIPVVYDPEGKAHLVPAENLPWLLPTDVDFAPSDSSPLSTSKELKERVTRIFGEGWTPEYDTLDTFVDSSWYYIRYLDPENVNDFSNQATMKRWLPVDRYSGGSEHTTMHLLYARFFHKALHDLGLVPTIEPFNERFNRGLIMGPDGQKMSKSKGNVVNPDESVSIYGADAVRMYLAFIGPYNEPGSYSWSPNGVEAMRRFLDRIYSLRDRVSDIPVPNELRTEISKASRKIADDTERFKLNTAVSALMVLVRSFEGEKVLSREAYRELLVLLAPYAPHLADHLWQEQAGVGSVHEAAWPESVEIVQETVTVVVQVNSKKKGELSLSPTATEEEALTAARGLTAIAVLLETGTPKRTVYVPGRILNIIM